mgnify:CR=1 FL=1
MHKLSKFISDLHMSTVGFEKGQTVRANRSIWWCKINTPQADWTIKFYHVPIDKLIGLWFYVASFL